MKNAEHGEADGKAEQAIGEAPADEPELAEASKP